MLKPSARHQKNGQIHNLLVIDDETEIIKALRRQFRRSYNVHVANSAEEGYSVMEKAPISVIISDQRMPGMTGSQFFDRVKTEYPDAIRLLLTGYADIQAVIDAINDGNIFRYIVKPWDPAELDTIVREAFERYTLIVQNRKLMKELKETNARLEQRVKERTAELQATNDELQRVNEEKDRFLGMAAHDLRGPIGNVKSISELLINEDIPEPQNSTFLRLIESVADKALNLINDLLSVSAVRAGRLVLEPIEVDLYAFLERVHQLNAHHGKKKDIELVNALPPDLPMIMFDEKRMEQVLDNLLTNAFKFSHAHTTVTVSASIQPSQGEEPSEQLVISVADQGQGIPNDELDTLFTAFQKTSTRPTAEEHSTGLGLTIVKRIVELHGGAITVESKHGVGTTFYVSLPR
ncbi:MAG: hybrid sensor histidine kinase/response regulator [Chloroflexota bacterium]